MCEDKRTDPEQACRQALISLKWQVFQESCNQSLIGLGSWHLDFAGTQVLKLFVAVYLFVVGTMGLLHRA